MPAMFSCNDKHAEVYEGRDVICPKGDYQCRERESPSCTTKSNGHHQRRLAIGATEQMSLLASLFFLAPSFIHITPDPSIAQPICV